MKLFLNLPAGGVNENNTHNQLLCGRITDIEQTYYSSHSTLAFEFHSDWRDGANRGFRGSFRFIAKSESHFANGGGAGQQQIRTLPRSTRGRPELAQRSSKGHLRGQHRLDRFLLEISLLSDLLARRAHAPYCASGAPRESGI